ncbi:TPA: hypothetical protein OUZ96_000386 [Legionella pneumophila]|nr:hypothetical protein [Legionella pneumophila subsp. pneumophila]HAU3487159.1 hypothetical protein [Legionella pneumophila]HAT8869645.1 hypothetical protein [Legionella pneumophila subsp. pneumophila]HAU3496722.1 hypothetical protein [Legionella pneumophila]HCU6104804.1 hypothetical protein [Legionella pneumophila]
MFNKRISQFIIGISKTVVPVVLILLLAPQLIRFTSELNSTSHFFQNHQIHFLILHGLFYLALYGCWPRLITVLINRCHYEISDSQIKLALQARNYLLAALIFFELLVWWR